MGFLREFHEHGRFVRSLNATFLVLVPKKGGIVALETLDLLVRWEACISCWQKC